LRANADLQQAAKQSTPDARGDFFLQIAGTITVRSNKESLESRSLELVNKTNQFNLNGRRFQEAEWKKWISAPSTVAVAVNYRDKYGPLGEIAVIAGELQNGGVHGRSTLHVRTWVMSCRAFSRLIEYECIRWLFDKLNVDEMEFDFLPTARNAPMRDFLQQFRSTPAEERCYLRRDSFLKNCPQSSHILEESANG
jgi:FkbH-like protein